MDRIFNLQFYNNIKQTNKIVENENKNFDEINSINNSLANYTRDDIQTYQILNSVLFIIYYCFLAILIYFVVVDKKKFNFIHHFFILFLLLYPFVIQPLQILLYSVFVYIKDYIIRIFYIDNI
jgi:hypothetical protein